jgi:Fe-S cluster biogenesis protein NfuA/nitrite reductase/ring-hydroxylating ferredoxin subunit
MSQAKNLRAVGDRIEHLLGEVRTISNTDIWQRVEETLGLVAELYGAGLAQVIEIAAGSEGEDRWALLDRLAEDELVASLLVLHGLHPSNLTTRVQKALDGVRPYLGSHGGDVELIGVEEEEGVVQLRMLGSCDGCPSSSVTLKLAVEGAIQEAAPEIVRIDVEGFVEPEPEADPKPAPAAGAAMPVKLGRKSEAEGGGQGAWAPVYGLHGLVSGRMQAIEIAGEPVVFCRVGKSLYAYRNVCPACGESVETGTLKAEVLTCGSCGASYDVSLAGRSLDNEMLHLDPLPLLESGEGGVKIAVPTGSAR